MSTNKLLQSLSEDPQLEKQIGCMTGILQLFDRHQVLTGRRLYGHKRIAAAASKTQTPLTSNCGSPVSDSSGIMSDNALRYSSEEQRPKHVPVTGVSASTEQQRNQPSQLPVTPTEMKGSLSYARTPSPTLNEASTEVNSRDRSPKISFDVARSSLLAPRRLDSSRSLHEARVNVPPENKVFARKSVDTAERAAAAARGALKELSRISTDFTVPNHHEDQVSIREIVRSSLGQDQHTLRSTGNPLLSNSSSSMQSSCPPPRMAGEADMYTPKASNAKDISRAHTIEFKSSSEFLPLQASSTSVPQAGKYAEAPRPPRHNYKPKMETPSKTCADISESLRLLAKLRETSPTYNASLGHEGAEEPKGNKNSSAAYHGPQPARPSVDLAREGPAFSSRVSLQRVSSERAPGRMSSYEPSRASSVDSLLQGGLRAREVHRLSLDGRAVVTGIKADREAGAQGKLHSKSLLTSRSVSCSNSDCDTESLHEKRTSFSSNVVAKLMGLDEMPAGDEQLHAHPKLSLSGSSDQMAAGASNKAIQDINPTFSQCGKYVSASFFPSKRRDDIKIPINLEEEEEDGYVQLKPLSHQEARTLNVRVGSLKLDAGDRLGPAENTNHLGPPCYQPRNHHLMEDRPPHVLSPAARICAQIEEMQRADSSYRELDRGARPLGLQQSSKTELEALKQLLSAIQFKRSCEGPLQTRGTPRKPQPESGRMPLLHEPHRQPEQPLEVTWNTKKMLNDEFDSQIHDSSSNVRRIAIESHSRRVRSGIHEEASYPSSRQYTFSDNYNQGPRFQSDVNISPGSSNSSLYNTPRKATMSNGYMSHGGTRNMHTNVTGVRKTVVNPHTSPPGMSLRSSTCPRTPSNQQLRSSNNASSSWEASSVSSTSSNNARDHSVVRGNSSHSASNKQGRPSERVEKKKGGILKDKEESKANIVSLKPNPLKSTEKKAKSGLTTAKSNSRALQRPIQAQKSDNLRSNMSSPTKSSAKKATEVKRKLSFSSRSRTGIHPSDVCSEDQEAEFVDKTVVSSTESMRLSDSCIPTPDLGEAGHDLMTEDPCVSVNFRGNDLGFNIDHPRTEGGATSALLLLADADAEASCVGHSDAEDVSSAVCTPTGVLRLPQVLRQENEDTESQGDKSTGSCEQPSPISVLEGPFYEDDVASPPTTTKFVLKLEELEEEARGKASVGTSPQHICLLSKRIGNVQNSMLTDFEYVKHLMEHSYLRQRDSENAGDTLGIWKLRPLDPCYFLQLEEELASNAGIDAAYKNELGSSMWRRKILFDSVNASLERRLHVWRLCQHQPWLLACERSLRGTVASGCSGALRQGIFGVDEENNLCLSREGGKVLLEEVWEEIEAKNAKQRGISSKLCTQRVNGSMGPSAYGGGEEEEEDGGVCDDVGHMLEEDIMGRSQPSSGPDAWDTLLLEKGELGLDLERLIFKDLIDHTIRDLGMLLLSPPSLTTKRQLFKLH